MCLEQFFLIEKVQKLVGIDLGYFEGDSRSCLPGALQSIFKSGYFSFE